MIARYQHLNDTDIIDATLQISGKKKREEKPPERLNEAKPLSVIEAAGHLFQIEEDNRTILENNKNMDAEVTGFRADVKGLNEIVELQAKRNEELKAEMVELKKRIGELLWIIHGD